MPLVQQKSGKEEINNSWYIKNLGYNLNEYNINKINENIF